MNRAPTEISMIKAILTDIEGTTSSLSFVKDILFPYARAYLADYVGASIERKASATSTSATMAGAEAGAGNGQDTNANSNDWVTRALREPQNSGSAAEP